MIRFSAFKSLAMSAAVLAAVALVAAACLCAVCPDRAFASAPAKAKIASVTSSSPGTLTVGVKKAKLAKGYQYWASTSKKFDKAATYDVKSISTKDRNATFTGLDEGKTYYVKARAYAKGKRYGKWSAVKSAIVQTRPADESGSADASERLEEYERQIASIRSELDSLRADLSSAKEASAQKDAELEDARANLKSAESEIARLTAALDEAGATGMPASIAYELDGGELPEGAKTSLAKEDGVYELPTPVKTGSDFEGWYDSDGNRVTAVTNRGYDITVYARWSVGQLFFAYVDSGATSARATEWDDASKTYVGAKLFDLYIGEAADAPKVGDEYRDGVVAAVSSSSDGSYPLGSVTLLTAADYRRLNLPSFVDCSSVDLSLADTSQVTDMSSQFEGCASLESVNVSGWDTSNVTSMSRMFAGCSSIAELDLSGFDTSNVTDMSYMFYNCPLLVSVNTSGWDTAKVRSMDRMYYYCTALESPGETNLNMANVTVARQMFSFCKAIGTIDFSGSSASSLVDVGAMFQMSSLKSLDVSTWDTSKATDMSFMFSGCTDLSYLKTGDGWSTGASWVGVQLNSPLYDEAGVLHSSFSYLPDGAHTYTRAAKTDQTS